MKLCIPFRVARFSVGADQSGNRTASITLVPKSSETPHDVVAALWGRKYQPTGEVQLHGVDPEMVMEFEPGASLNVILEVL